MCEHFRNVASDAPQGILTDQELREKLREVDDNAVIATDAVRQGARDMLAAITSGTAREFSRAIRRTDRAWTAAGW
jgi:hypothetical protein